MFLFTRKIAFLSIKTTKISPPTNFTLLTINKFSAQRDVHARSCNPPPPFIYASFLRISRHAPQTYGGRANGVDIDVPGVDRDPAPVVPLDAELLQPEAVGVGPASDAHQQHIRLQGVVLKREIQKLMQSM